MCKVLRLKLLRVFVTTSERDTFVSLFTRPAYVVLESEARVKNTALRMYVFKVLCIAVKHHGHAFGNSPPPLHIYTPSILQLQIYTVTDF